MTLARLFREHVAERQRKAEGALSAAGFDRLVLSSGKPHTYFADDADAPFHSVAHFAHWCPIEGPHHVLSIVPGKKPLLIRHAPEDYWYEPHGLSDPFWLPEFEVVEAATVDAVWERLGAAPNAAYIGNETKRAAAAGLAVNPEKLLARLDWDRAYKTDYEIQCLDEASAKAAIGHRAARTAFESGASELEIHYAFVQAMGVTDDELPYHSIIALNEKAAFLHYVAKRSVRNGKVLLIDAAARSRGYASDITRTHVSKDCDPRFVALRDAVERAQQELCGAVRPGIPFQDLHRSADRKIAALLRESDILRAAPEETEERGLSRPFFPHGLGHHLGLQVHDVGGHLKDPEGNRAPPPPEHPHLRNTRTVEPRHVLTIEPGLYFIEMLLRPFRSGDASGRFNWKLIDELSPLGGIRIEDDVVVVESGHRNLTRAYLAGSA
jgi:Xaa-Pro dipeptidase